MSLAKRLLNNPGLLALTVQDEQIELAAVAVKNPQRKIKFAFFQNDSNGGRIPFWHVNYRKNEDGLEEFGTTLSLQGLKDWGYL